MSAGLELARHLGAMDYTRLSESSIGTSHAIDNLGPRSVDRLGSGEEQPFAAGDVVFLGERLDLLVEYSVLFLAFCCEGDQRRVSECQLDFAEREATRRVNSRSF